MQGLVEENGRLSVAVSDLKFLIEVLGKLEAHKFLLYTDEQSQQCRCFYGNG